MFIYDILFSKKERKSTIFSPGPERLSANRDAYPTWRLVLSPEMPIIVVTREFPYAKFDLGDGRKKYT